MRLTKNVTGFPAGINVASTFSRRLMRARGKAMAEEFRGKGAQWVLRFQWKGTPIYATDSVLLGPAMDIVSLIIPWIVVRCNVLFLDAQSQGRAWLGKACWTPVFINHLVISDVMLVLQLWSRPVSNWRGRFWDNHRNSKCWSPSLRKTYAGK